ncbi:MAG: ATP-binding cassette domain-containing protein [Lachnospiraceae bacterium]|nr:ATP-binding cassette domain-containing protein [Lachnospiraceae bacterium]
MSGIILKAQGIFKNYITGNRMVSALAQMDLEIEEGLFYAVVGRSGSGKTTLLQLLSSLEQADGGEIWLEEEAYSTLQGSRRALLRRKKIGVVFQEYRLMPELNVYENIVLPILLDDKSIDEKYIGKVMKVLEIEELQQSYPHQLSGGELQRTAIARAMANRPRLIFADEPTGQLDETSAFQVMKLLKEANTVFGQTIMMVTHNKQMAQYADKILVLDGGKLIKGVQDE